MTSLVILAATLTALAAAVFVIMYAPRHWWTHVTGRQIMATKVGIFVLAVAEIVAQFAPKVGSELLILAWIHLAYVMVWRVWYLWRARPAPTEVSTPEEADL